jgi:hypothetical protein
VQDFEMNIEEGQNPIIDNLQHVNIEFEQAQVYEMNIDEV